MHALISRIRRRLTRHHPEAGFSDAVELVLIAPAIVLFIGLIAFAGRLHTADAATLTAAQEAARAASITRTPTEAQAQAQSTAAETLSSAGLTCSSTSVLVDASQMTLPAGTTGTISVSVSCTVPLSDISLPGIPGQRTITANASSVIDTYRERP